MKHKMSLYIADIEKNVILDFFDGDKVLCFIQEVSFKPKIKVTEEYFKQVMKKSKRNRENDGCWIAAIDYMGNVFKEDELKIIVT